MCPFCVFYMVSPGMCKFLICQSFSEYFFFTLLPVSCDFLFTLCCTLICFCIFTMFYRVGVCVFFVCLCLCVSSISVYLFLSVCLSFSLCLSMCLSFCFCLYLCLSLFLFFFFILVSKTWYFFSVPSLSFLSLFL